MVSNRKKDLLRLMADGPTLQQLTQRINEGSRDQISSQSVGELLVSLRDEGYVFLEGGRWWRTPEGITFLEELSAEELAQRAPEKYPPKKKRARFSWTREETPQQAMSKAIHSLRAHVTSLRHMPADMVLALVVGLAVLVLKLFYSYSYLLPGWDSTVYLLNARRFLYGYDPSSFFELLRPPLLPCIIAIFFAFFGDNYRIAVSIQPVFTVLAGLILYRIVREMFDWPTAMLSLLIFLFTPEIFKSTNLLLTHGVELPFALLCVFYAWKTRSKSATPNRFLDYGYAALVGLFAALVSLTRYPAIIFFPAVVILVLRRNIVWTFKWIATCGLSFVVTWLPWLSWNIDNANGDPFASVKAAFSVGVVMKEPPPWHYYLTGLAQMITIVGAVLFIVGIIGRESFRDRKRLLFICWFAVSIAAFSSIPNKELRFAIEFFPAVAVLVALGARRIQSFLRFKPKRLFNILLVSWLVYLIWSSSVEATASVNSQNGPAEKEFPTVVSWVTTNVAKYDIGVSDTYAPQFSYFAKRLFYSFVYVASESTARGMSIREFLTVLNVTYVVVTSSYDRDMNLGSATYLIMLKQFQHFVAYAVIGSAGARHMGILVVGKYGASAPVQTEFAYSRLAIEETIRGVFSRFDTIDSSSFFTKLEDAYAVDGHPRYGLIVLADEIWNDASQRLNLEPTQLSVLRRLVEEQGTALLTSGKATQGWLSETHRIPSNGTSRFTAFQIAASRHIADWSNLLGPDKTWNVESASQLVTFPSSPPNVETIVETSTRPGRMPLVWIGYEGKGRVAHFCCSTSDLSFSKRMSAVNPVLIRVLFWLLGDYPRVVKGTGFKVALRIDDAQAALYSSIEKHASALVYQKGVPLSLAVIPLDLTNATAALLLRLKQSGCELVLHGAPGHYGLLTLKNQTQGLLEGKELFKRYLGFYPTILAPPGLSLDLTTIHAAETLGFVAVSGSTIEATPPGGRGTHFGYFYGNTTVVMLPTLPLLDTGPYGEWWPSAELALARTKWLLASQKWIDGSCIITFHFNDSRLPEIVRLVDWAKSIGAEFTTMEQMVNDTFMSPSLEQYSPTADTSSFSSFDMIQNARLHATKISFTLNHPIKLRLNLGRDVEYYNVDGRTKNVTGTIIVTDTLDTGREHTIIIQSAS